MHSLYSIVSPASVNFRSPKLSPMAATATTVSSMSFASTVYGERKTATTKRSAKPSKTLSPTTSPPPIPTSTTANANSNTALPTKKVILDHPFVHFKVGRKQMYFTFTKCLVQN